jgi:hypothetical protein
MGVGLGPSMSTFNIAIQNAVPRSHMGVATSASQFFRQIGGTVGIAVFGAVLTHTLASAAARAPASPGGPAHPLDMAALQRLALAASGEGGGGLPPEALAVRGVVVEAITSVFTGAVGVAAAAFLLVLLIPVLPLEARSGPRPPAGVEGAAEGLAEGEA